MLEVFKSKLKGKGKKILKFWVIGWAVLILMASGLHYTGIMVNVQASMPKGLYKKVSGLPEAGDIAVIQLDFEWFVFARDRGYLTTNFMKTGARPTFKFVRAGQGDSVRITAEGVEVNGVLLENTAQARTDSKGRSMPSLDLPLTVLKKGEFIVISWNHNKGFDSRYYGILNESNLISKAEKVF